MEKRSTLENMVALKTADFKFWKNKRVFLTGHTSFKGSWLKLWLEFFGSKVIGYSIDYPSKPYCLFKNLFNEKLKKESILNYQKLKKKIVKSKPEIVFHLAAQSILSEANKNPIKNYETNILGTANLLEACYFSKSVKLVVIVTTDKCYEENLSKKSYNENSKLGGSEPYSVSKACAELISKSYQKKYKEVGKKIITLRAGNVVGGGDWKKNRLVPDVFKSIISKKPLIIRHPSYIRPWHHVLDCLNGYLLASEYAYKKKIIFDSWNFAPNIKDQIKVSKFIKILLLRMNNKSHKINFAKKVKFYESKRLNLNSSKAKRELNWKTILNMKQTIDFINNWYLNFGSGYDMKKFSIMQIKEFYNLSKKK